MTLSFFVSGLPVAQGSLKWFPVKGPRRIILTSTAKGLKPWREVVCYAAREAMQKAGATMTTEAVAGGMTFILPRPKALKNKATPRHTKRPDLDKLQRAGLDAMSRIVYFDDSQVDDWLPMPGRRKRYAKPGETPGVEIRVEMLSDAP